MFRFIKVLRLILVFSLITNWLYGQDLEFETLRENGKIFSQKATSIIPSEIYILDNASPFSSISIQIDKSQSFDGAYLLINNDTFLLSKDEHIDANKGLINSNLVSFELPVNKVLFYSNQITGRTIFNFINGSVSHLERNEDIKRIQSDCLDEPASIEQLIWRNGLSEPQYNRSYSEVKHLIIHHSAGSNTNVNYTQVVRDIYIYHTEVNGWSDIGYNYLIAQDGTIFKGRDPDAGSQDDVRGAHFCGMNTGTMGVCLLGDYTSIPPTNEAIQALLNLISWKLDKEDLNAFESFSFNSIPNLESISGHRDGCATECPGTKTYQKIAEYRRSANTIIEECYPDDLIADFTWSKENILAGETVSFNDTSQGFPLSWQWEMTGAAVENYIEQNPVDVLYPNKGAYDVSLVIRNGSRTDTASITNLIIVDANPFAVPSVFPNPVTYNNPLNLIMDITKISDVEIVDLKGDIILKFSPRENHIKLDHTSLRAGVYFFRFFSEGNLASTEKIVIIN
jgi:hypothetical protein